MQHSKRLLVIGLDHRTREMVKGIQAYCRLHGQWEFHWEDGGNPNSISRVHMAIHKWKADGIFAHIRLDPLSRLIRRTGRPIVNLSGWRDTDLPTVISDGVAVGRMAARHFLDNGFWNFAFCARTIERYVQRRCDGFVHALAEAGYGCNAFTDEFSGEVETDWIRNIRRMDQWLLSLPKPTAILCMYDLRAQEVAMACHRLGLRVPDEVAIVGVENDDICEMCAPPLSSVDIDLHKIGYEAMRLLHRILRGYKATSNPVLIAPRRVVVRESSDTITIPDPDVSAAVRFIRDHAHEHLRVKEILDHVPISRKTLEIKFQKLLGRSPGEEIIRVRMERVKNLLAETDLPIPTVVQKTGFSGANNFSVFFRRQMHMTPRQYRRSRSAQTSGNSSGNDGTPHIKTDGSAHNPTNFLSTLSREQRQRLYTLAAPSRSYSRLKPPDMKRIIVAICQETFLTAAKLGELLHRNPNGLRGRFLKPMMNEGLLRRKYPDEPNRPDQAYTATPHALPSQSTRANV